MILNLQQGEKDPPVLPCERLGRKNMNLFKDDETGLKLARLAFITFGEKFRDDILDNKSIKAKMATWIFSRPMKEAKAAEPELARSAYEGTDRINELQDTNANKWDVLSAYGDMSVAALGQFAPLTDKTAALVRAMSEWIFFIDMICDYDEDYGNDKAYNGFKTPGCPTFCDYFNLHYREFLADAQAVTNRLVTALYDVKDNSRTWNTLCKVIMNAVDTVIPFVIEGKDVKFHYFKELKQNYRALRRVQRDSRKLGVRADEES